MEQIAEDLRTGCSETSLKSLKVLKEALSDPWSVHNRARLFLQAGGLSPLIHLLKGPAPSGTTSSTTSDADILRSAISFEAGVAVNQLLALPSGKAELVSSTTHIRPFTDALREAPDTVGRVAAAHGLMLLAYASPAKRKAVAQAGVVGVLLTFFLEVGDAAFDRDKMWTAWGLAHALVRLEKIARRHLREAICGPQPDQAFAALDVLHDALMVEFRCLPKLDKEGMVAALYNEGVVDALVATLNHESPYCVAAAVANLSQVSDSRQAFKASGALPALVRVIERARPPAAAKTTGLYGRETLALETKTGETKVVGYNNPTASALAALGIVLESGALLEDFIEVGGASALVGLLRDATCPITAEITATLIAQPLNVKGDMPIPSDYFSELAELFFESGVCQSALEALSMQPREADLEELTQISRLLWPLFAYRISPLEASLVPDLVRALWQNKTPPPDDPGCCTEALRVPLSCLEDLLRRYMDIDSGLWKAAVDAGAVPLFVELLRHGQDEGDITQVVEMCGLLLMPAPKGEVGSWGVRLLRAIAQLLGAAQPRAPRAAAAMLCNVALVHPELFADCHAWGIEDGLRRLTTHSDPDTAAAAWQLTSVFLFHKAAEGQNQPTRPGRSPAGTLDPSSTGSGSRHKPEAPSRASREQQQLSVGPDPPLPGEGTSGMDASPGDSGVHEVRACARCGITAEEMLQAGGEVSQKRSLKECGACKSVRYCGKACQTADWPAHKATCKRLKAAARK